MKIEYRGGRVSRLVETIVDLLKWILIYRPGDAEARMPQPVRVLGRERDDRKGVP